MKNKDVIKISICLVLLIVSSLMSGFIVGKETGRQENVNYELCEQYNSVVHIVNTQTDIIETITDKQGEFTRLTPYDCKIFK